MAKVPFLDISEREYKKMMRKRYRNLKKAMGEFSPGCAHVPKEAYTELNRMFNAFNKSLRICMPWWKKA